MLVHKLLQSLFILLVLNSFAFAQAWTWRRFSPENQPWSILAPGQMAPDAEAQDPNGSKGSYAYNDFNGFFAVIYRDTPRRWVPWKPDFNKYIEEVRDDVVRANRGELVQDIRFTYRGMVGREAQVKFPSGTAIGAEGQTITTYRVQRFRMFFVGNRFYIVLAVANENEIDSPEISKYFSSFAVNSAPKTGVDSYSTPEDATLTVSASRGVLANDSDDENDTLKISAAKALTQPEHGTLAIKPDGSFTYKPKPNYSGTDRFTYKASDGIAESSETTVTLTINPVNDAPVLSGLPPSVMTDELKPIGFTATASDIDSAASNLRFGLSGAPAGATIDPKTGVFAWTPNEAQGPGNYTFRVTVSDGETSSGAPVSTEIREVNAAPQLTAFPASATINELEPYLFAVKAADSDVPVQSLIFSLVGAPAGAAINPQTGAITWSPTETQGDNSTYRFTVRVSDGVVATEAAASITVREVNSAPVLAPIADQSIDELKPLSITLRGSDADIPGNGLTYSLDAGAPGGMAINPKTGVISWTPDEAQGAGEYTITARLTDNGSPALSDAKTFKIRVSEVNVAPILAPIGGKTVDEETSLTFKAAATDVDLPANALTYSLANAPGGAVIDSATGVFRWTPTEAQGAGSYTLTVRVTDNGAPALSDEETFTITVNEVNKPPVAEGASANVDEDGAVSISLKASDADLPANALSYSIVGAPAHGKLSGSGANLTYTPNANFNGSDSFTFRVSDGSLASNVAIVSVQVKPVNDAPVARADAASTVEGAPVVINVTGNDADIDGDAVVLSGVSGAANGKAEIVGNEVRFTPDPQFRGAATFTYTITDGKGGTATATVTVAVNPAEQPKQK